MRRSIFLIPGFFLVMVVSAQVSKYQGGFDHYIDHKQLTVTQENKNKLNHLFKPSSTILALNIVSPEEHQTLKPTTIHDKTPISSHLDKQLKSSANKPKSTSKERKDFDPDNWYKFNILHIPRSVIYTAIDNLFKLFDPIIRPIYNIVKEVRVYVFRCNSDGLSNNCEPEKVWVITRNGKNWQLGIALYSPDHDIDRDTTNIDLKYALNFIIDEHLFTPKLVLASKMKIGNKWLAYVKIQRTIRIPSKTTTEATQPKSKSKPHQRNDGSYYYHNNSTRFKNKYFN